MPDAAEDRLRRFLGTERVPAGARQLVPSHDTRPWGELRTPTPLETLTNWLYRTTQGAAAHPLGKISDLIGLTDLAGMAGSYESPPMLLRGEVPGLPGKPAGFFSRVDRIAQSLPAKGVHPNKLASLLKSGASQEEVAYRNIPELLASKGNAPVTQADLMAHLAAHPAPVPEVKTLGAGPSNGNYIHDSLATLAQPKRGSAKATN